MGDKSAIEWTDATWNPTVGCSIVSPGCTNCYAMKMAARIERMNPAATHYQGLTESSKAGPVWTGKIGIAGSSTLHAPLAWRRPRRIFVNSMSDLFHEGVPDQLIDQVFAVMALTPRHTYQVLTKRAERMRDYLSAARVAFRIDEACDDLMGRPGHDAPFWPLPNVWLGVSAERPEEAMERLPALRATPAAKRFVSVEPMLAAIEPELLGLWGEASIDWIIIGGESGPGARPFWAPWARSIVKAARAAGMAVFVKQMGSNVQDRNDAGFEGCDAGEWHLADELAQVVHDVDGYRDEAQGAPVRIRLRDRKGGDWSEWPEDLRVREFPAP